MGPFMPSGFSEFVLLKTPELCNMESHDVFEWKKKEFKLGIIYETKFILSNHHKLW